MLEPPYKRKRLDGWPYCPKCNEDELYCKEWPPSVARITGCYVCGWRPGMEPVSSPNRSV